MSDLPPDARELLARARREQLRSTPAMRARVRAGVAEAVALSQTPAVEELEATKLAGAKATMYSTYLKLATAGVVVGLTGGLLLRGTPPAVSPAAPRAQERVAAQPGAELPPKAADAVPQVRMTENTNGPASGTGSRTTGGAASPTTANARVGQDSLGAELRLVRQADQALRAGDAPAALKALTLHRARFGNGQLAHERDGLALLAECTLGKPGARERASSYLRQHPSSLVEERLVSACALREPP